MALWSRVPERQRRQITSDWFADGCPMATRDTLRAIGEEIGRIGAGAAAYERGKAR